MNIWDLAAIILIGLAALSYLVLYIRKELSARKNACSEENAEACGSFCNACGKKRCPIEKVNTCASFPGKDVKDVKSERKS